MKTTVIDSLNGITIRGNAGSSPELVAISGEKLDKACNPLDNLELLLASLSMDDKTAGKIMDTGSSIFARGEECGFRRGFRVAVRLMMESVEVPESPEAESGGAEHY